MNSSFYDTMPFFNPGFTIDITRRVIQETSLLIGETALLPGVTYGKNAGTSLLLGVTCILIGATIGFF